jgi:excisionase family DNA binding protein
MAMNATTELKPAALTISEAGTALHMSRASIYRRIEDGTIRAVKIGSLTRIPVSEIRRLLDTEVPA